jgi:hypothetical protein
VRDMTDNIAMTTCKLILMILLGILWGNATAVTLPGDNFASGWTKPVKPLTYNTESLADYIDGDAELFLEMGFQQLQVQQYIKGKSEIDLEAYEFADPNGAMGIYLLRAGKENPFAEVGGRNTVSQTQLLAVKGNCFFQIMNYSNDASAAAAMTSLAKAALANITVADSATVLQRLPKAQLQAGSEHLFRGPLSLQAIYHLGKGDVLNLQKKIFGVSGKFNDVNLGVHTLIVVPYSDIASAQAAFAILQKSLDPGFQVFGKTATGFGFKDRQAKYAMVELKGSMIEMRVGLAKKPC